MTLKQVIVVRKDLNMRKGKIAAQVAHASVKVVLDQMESSSEHRILTLISGTPLQQWLDGLFTKVVVSVDSEEELLELYKNAIDAGIPNALITDCGATEFHGVPTKTCLAIGPEYPEKLDPITGHLKLM